MIGGSLRCDILLVYFFFLYLVLFFAYFVKNKKSTKEKAECCRVFAESCVEQGKKVFVFFSFLVEVVISLIDSRTSLILTTTKWMLS